MSQRDDGAIIRDSLKCAFDVLRARPDIAQTDQPERLAVLLNPYDIIFQHSNADPIQGTHDALSVIPPIVISEHGVNAQSSAQTLQFVCDHFRLDKVSTDHILDHEITREQDQVWLLPIDRRNDLLQLLDIYMRRADVQIRDDRDLQSRQRWRPSAQTDQRLVDHQPVRL